MIECLIECLAWWHLAVIPALERLQQEDLKFPANLGCVWRHYLKQAQQFPPQVSDSFHKETDKYPGQLQPEVAMRSSAQESEDRTGKPF